MKPSVFKQAGKKKKTDNTSQESWPMQERVSMTTKPTKFTLLTFSNNYDSKLWLCPGKTTTLLFRLTRRCSDLWFSFHFF